MSALLPKEKKLTTSFAYNEVEAVDDFNVSALVRDHSAGAPSQAPSTTARATRRNISREEPCFITKRRCYTLERVHWVKAVKKDPLRKKEIVCCLLLPKLFSSLSPFFPLFDQETFLRGLGIVHARFDLNDTTNLTNSKVVDSTCAIGPADPCSQLIAHCMSPSTNTVSSLLRPL